MCICCCKTRNLLILYKMIIIAIALVCGIYRIFALPSNSIIYKFFKEEIDRLDKSLDLPDTSSSYYRILTFYDNSKIKKILKNQNLKEKRKMEIDDDYFKNSMSENDFLSLIRIMGIKKEDLKKHSYTIIQNLKGIEIGFEVLYFILNLFFIVFEIIYSRYTKKEKEYKVLPAKIFNIFNNIKIISITLSSILIAINIAYICLLIAAISQYLNFTDFDTCAFRLVTGIIISFYYLWYYITLVILFEKERKILIEVGTDEKPGPQAKYDISGRAISQNNTTSPVTIINVNNNDQQQQIVSEARTIEVQQNNNENKNQQQIQQSNQLISTENVRSVKNKDNEQ